jgi:hypothetical protein
MDNAEEMNKFLDTTCQDIIMTKENLNRATIGKKID